MITEALLNTAIKTAERSNVVRGKVAAVLYTSSGHIIAKGYNSVFMGSPRFKTVHAEEAVLSKARKLNTSKRFRGELRLLVIRWKRGTKELANAKPCPCCQRSLSRTNWTIFYSDEQGILREFCPVS